MPRQKADLHRRAQLWAENNLADRTLSEYEPFLTVRDVPSRGRRHRIPSLTCGRLHHLMSDLEASAFYNVDYTRPLDIREQYPLLPLTETQEIAQRLDVRHPAYGGRLHIMTTDLLVTARSGAFIPICVKPSEELGKTRIREKLEIERVYWANRQLTLRVMTERSISKTLSSAVAWVHAYDDVDDLGHAAVEIRRHSTYVDDVVSRHRDWPLAEICKRIDTSKDLTAGTALMISRHLIATRTWRIDLRQGIDTLQPLSWLTDREVTP